MSGTWSLSNGGIAVAWFAEAAALDEEGLAEEVARLGMIRDRPLPLTIQTA